MNVLRGFVYLSIYQSPLSHFRIEDVSNGLLLGQGQFLGKVNLKGQNEVSAVVIEHQWRQRIRVVDRHTFPFEDLPKLGCDYLVWPILNYFSVERFEFNGGAREGLDKRNIVSVNEVVSFSAVRLVNSLFDVDNQVTSQFVRWTVAFAWESECRSCRHAWFDFDLFPHDFIFDRPFVSEESFALKFEFFGGAVEEFFEGTFAGNGQIRLVGLVSFRYRIFVHITLYFLNHLDLVAGAVQSDRVRVCGPEKHLKNFKGVSVERVAFDLARLV